MPPEQPMPFTTVTEREVIEGLASMRGMDARLQGIQDSIRTLSERVTDMRETFVSKLEFQQHMDRLYSADRTQTDRIGALESKHSASHTDMGWVQKLIFVAIGAVVSMFGTLLLTNGG